jgi:glycosyltransferase involved in cell wall biosynthesis
MVSVIIPNYNHARFLKERIDSVLNQNYKDIEVIILDDCSTDNSREIIESYRGHEKITRIEFNETNSGSTFKQWEKGINLAKGEWIWIAESDDVADLEFLSTLIVEIGKNEVNVAYCCSQIIDENSKPNILYGFKNMPSKDNYPQFNIDFKQNGEDFINEWMLRDNFLPNASAVLINSKSFDNNIFDNLSNMCLMGDWLFWIRLLKNGRVFYTQSVLNNFRNHKDTVRSNSNNRRTLEFPFIFSEFLRNSKQRKVLVDTFLYRYFTSEFFKMFTWKDHWIVLINCFKEGEGLRYVKSLLKNIL